MDSKHSALNARKLKATPRGVGVMCQWYAEKAENSTIWDAEGINILTSRVVLRY
jgi:4-aminobutyrate aminotransferase